MNWGRLLDYSHISGQSGCRGEDIAHQAATRKSNKELADKASRQAEMAEMLRAALRDAGVGTDPTSQPLQLLAANPTSLPPPPPPPAVNPPQPAVKRRKGKEPATNDNPTADKLDTVLKLVAEMAAQAEVDRQRLMHLETLARPGATALPIKTELPTQAKSSTRRRRHQQPNAPTTGPTSADAPLDLTSPPALGKTTSRLPSGSSLSLSDILGEAESEVSEEATEDEVPEVDDKQEENMQTEQAQPPDHRRNPIPDTSSTGPSANPASAPAPKAAPKPRNKSKRSTGRGARK